MDFTPSERATFSLIPGDILLNEGQSLELVGRSAIYEGEPSQFCFQNTLIRFRAYPPNDYRFCHAVFSQWLENGRFTTVARQTTSVAHLGADRLASMAFPVPPPSVQRKIARILTTLDNLIEKTESLIAKYRAIKQGMMHDLFTRGIDERGHLRPPQAEAPDLYKQSELGWIPKDWRVASIGELFDKRTEHGKPGLPVMSIVMVEGLVERSSVDRRVESNLPPNGHALVLKGDIAYNMMRMWQGVLGRASFDCLVSPAYVVLKPKETITTHFAAFLFSDERSILKFRQFSQGVVDDRLRLYFHDLEDITFAIPTSLDEQEQLAQRIETCNKRVATETAALEQFRQLRLGLMQDLLTGKVRVKVDELEEVADA
jgi:type I restriction enzyme S subunit